MTELEFGTRLKQLRQNKHLTQQELADQLGVSNKSVSRWESGGYPDVTTLAPLAKALGVTTDELLGCQPPLRSFGRSDWQNLMSYAFALGGGVVFYLLDLFMPALICYLIYLAMMAYGIYLQRHYTYHSHWFYGANALMDFFVNLRLTVFVAGGQLLFTNIGTILLSMRNLLTRAEAGRLNWWYLGKCIMELLWCVLPWLLLTMALSVATQWIILCTGSSRAKIHIVPGSFTFGKALPAFIPLVMCAFFALYLTENHQYAWAYEMQVVLFLSLWLAAAILTVLWLLLRNHRWMLLPAGIMLLLCLFFPSLASRRVYSDITNRFMPYSTSLKEGMYTIFGQFGPQLLIVAFLLAALYLVCCMLKLESTPK